jgi:hypothetical protein
MASKREDVLNAIKTMVTTALPFAEVKRNLDKPRTAPGGLVNILDGDPGDPEEEFSPHVYIYTHRVPIEVVPPPSENAEAALDTMLSAIGTTLSQDPYLGELCQWVEAEAPVTDDMSADGTPKNRSASFALICIYETTSPLN